MLITFAAWPLVHCRCSGYRRLSQQPTLPLQDTGELVLIIFAAWPLVHCRCSGSQRLSQQPTLPSQDTGELVLIIFAAWALVDFKNRLLHLVATNLLMASES